MTDFRDQAFDLLAFGEDLNSIRRARKLTLRKAGEESGVAFNTLMRIEHGQKASSVESVTRAAMWADLSLDAYKRFRR